MKRGGHKIKSIRSILISASLVISTIAFAIVVNLFAFNSDNYDTTWEGTKCYQWVTDSSVNPGLACDSKTGHQTRGGVCKKRIEVQSKADMEANNEAASSSSGTTDDSADPDSSTDPDDASASGDEDSCEQGLHGFGWIICPGQTIVSNLVNFLMTWIDGSMQYTVLANEDTIFAIAFLIMIYSMATSTGLSNYHVKKILPKIIVMAVIVNISFYICAAALDISNIVGYNISEFIWSMSKSSGDGPIDTLISGVSDVIIFVAALFFGGSLIVALGIILLAIGFRHVVLTVLVIISPVALSLYMLPNTEKWAKKWINTFVSLLIVYPAFGAVWGASRLLSNTFTVLKGSSVIGSISYAIMPTICSIAPAIAIIPLFKMSSGLMGYIAGRAAGSSIARGAIAKGNSISRGAGRSISRKPVGVIAKGVANHTKDTGRIGLKAREVSAWAETKPNGRQERAMKLASLEKSANEQASAIVGTLTQSEQLSALTRNDGRYTDRYGNVRKLDMNLDDPHIYSALLTSQAPNLPTQNGELRDTASATAIRIQTLRNNGQHQAADSLQIAAATALSSNQNSNLSTSQMHTVLSSGANAATQYNASVIDNAINKTVAEDIPKKSAVQIDEINNIMKTHGSGAQKGSWKGINAKALADSKISNKLNANQRQSVTYASKII